MPRVQESHSGGRNGIGRLKITDWKVAIRAHEKSISGGVWRAQSDLRRACLPESVRTNAQANKTIRSDNQTLHDGGSCKER
jgi:hypothetical protein